MGKKRHSNHEDDKGRMRLVLVEVDCNNDSLQDALKTFSNAFSKPSVVTKVVHVQPQKQLDWEDSDQLGTDGELPVSQAVDLGDLDESEDDPKSSSRRRQSSNSNRDPNASLTLQKDLNLHPEGKPTFTEFFESLGPTSQLEKVAVIVYYLAEVLELPQFGVNHVYTCFSVSKARMPKDLRKVIRNTASQKGWVDSKTATDLKITTAGRNHVEHDMQGNSASEE